MAATATNIKRWGNMINSTQPQKIKAVVLQKIGAADMYISNYTPFITYTQLIVETPPEMILRLYVRVTLCNRRNMDEHKYENKN